MNDLKDTIELMLSTDHSDRLKAEYYQTKIRFDKLHNMIVKMEAGTLEFESTCPIDLFKIQINAMEKYLYALEIRAQIEGVKL